MFETLGLWSYPLVTLGLVIFIIFLIVATNLLIDYRRNTEILKKDIYKRYQKDFPKLRQDFTLEELREFDGMHEAREFRILTAVDGLIFDVTKRWDLYGPAGRDASRSLANFQTNLVADNYDNLCDLSVKDIDNLEEWKRQFCETYLIVGRLLKPGQEGEKFEYQDGEEIPVVYKTDY